MKSIKVAVKYCGGCNPYYDRSEAVNIIRSKLTINLEAYNVESTPDIVLIICGCKSECIDVKAYKSRLGTVLLNDIKSVDGAIDTILRLGCI